MLRATNSISQRLRTSMIEQSIIGTRNAFTRSSRGQTFGELGITWGYGHTRLTTADFALTAANIQPRPPRPPPSPPRLQTGALHASLKCFLPNERACNFVSVGRFVFEFDRQRTGEIGARFQADRSDA